MREKAVDLLKNHPALFANMLGFNKLTELHNEWIKTMVTCTEDKTLMAHRASYKTTCVSFAIAIIMILFPDKKTLFMRKTDADVKEVIRQVAKILSDEKTLYILQCLYGESYKLGFTTLSMNEINTNLSSAVKGTSQLVGIGIGGSITGKHFDNIFTDDIVNVQDRISKAERDKTKLVYQELQNIKNRGGKIFNTGTPWHKEDAFTLMPNADKYDCYSTGIMTHDQIEELKLRMSPSLFCANYELRHIASEDVIFTAPQKGAGIENVYNGIAHVDSAFYGEDFTAFTVMQRHDGKYYVFGKVWRKHIEDCYDDIYSYYASLLCKKLYNETNADKGMVARDMRKNGIKVVTYHEKINKHIKIVTYLKAIWSDVIFVEGTDESFINQICDYTEDAEHDDAPDSMACLARIFYKKKDIVQSSLFI